MPQLGEGAIVDDDVVVLRAFGHDNIVVRYNSGSASRQGDAGTADLRVQMVATRAAASQASAYIPVNRYQVAV
jgi:hypothetical protein